MAPEGLAQLGNLFTSGNPLEGGASGRPWGVAHGQGRGAVQQVHPGRP